jgi:hypothetical protein
VQRTGRRNPGPNRAGPDDVCNHRLREKSERPEEARTPAQIDLLRVQVRKAAKFYAALLLFYLAVGALMKIVDMAAAMTAFGVRFHRWYRASEQTAHQPA